MGPLKQLMHHGIAEDLLVSALNSRLQSRSTNARETTTIVRQRNELPNECLVSTSLHNLAQFLHDTFRLSEAELLLRRAIAIDNVCLPPDHPHVAARLNNLALLLLETNALEEAEGLMYRSLAINLASPDLDPSLIANRLNNLADIFQRTNRLDEAEPLRLRALALEKAIDPHHPNVARCYNNLATLRLAQGHLAEAV
jgi:tetratricopeptide (TPR) repeat protein